MLDNFFPPYESTVGEKFQQAGAVMLGKPTWMNLPWLFQRNKLLRCR